MPSLKLVSAVASLVTVLGAEAIGAPAESDACRAAVAALAHLNAGRSDVIVDSASPTFVKQMRVASSGFKWVGRPAPDELIARFEASDPQNAVACTSVGRMASQGMSGRGAKDGTHILLTVPVISGDGRFAIAYARQHSPAALAGQSSIILLERKGTRWVVTSGKLMGIS